MRLGFWHYNYIQTLKTFFFQQPLKIFYKKRKRKRRVDMNQSKMDADLDMLMPEEMTEDFSLLGEEKEISGQGLKKKKHFKVKDTPKNVDGGN